ncbi:hypothetical protein ACSFA3_19880 [Variovorax sp. RHLX14]|uniref:hypothetical protein n=1 Tax=Variovorax sp. RHLX14 TaxID=1259731 RepID=UPI003F46A708
MEDYLENAPLHFLEMVMLIVTKVIIASGVAALAMGGPAVVSPLDSGSSGTGSPVAQSAQAELSRQMQAMPPCQAGCNLWQAMAGRH